MVVNQQTKRRELLVLSLWMPLVHVEGSRNPSRLESRQDRLDSPHSFPENNRLPFVSAIQRKSLNCKELLLQSGIKPPIINPIAAVPRWDQQAQARQDLVQPRSAYLGYKNDTHEEKP